MQQRALHFVVANDPEQDFDLIKEVYKDNELLADIRQVGGEWQITFFSEYPSLELSWEDLQAIHQAFSQFIAEMLLLNRTERDENDEQ